MKFGTSAMKIDALSALCKCLDAITASSLFIAGTRGQNYQRVSKAAASTPLYCFDENQYYSVSAIILMLCVNLSCAAPHDGG